MSEILESGRFSPSNEGWIFAGALTLDGARAVLDASKELPLPASGVVDFGGLMQADSAALAVMMALKRRAAAEGRTLTMRGLPGSLHSLAVAYGVENLLD